MSESAFQRWYAGKKDEFNRARAERRKNDPEYAARQKRYKQKAQKPDPENGLVLAEAARQLGTTIWVLNGWRAKKLFPDPLKYKGGLWVHSYNLKLLKKLLEFSSENPRVSSQSQGMLEDLSNWVFANWQPLEAPHGSEDK